MGIDTDRQGNRDNMVCARFVGNPDTIGDPGLRILLVVDNAISDLED